MTRSATRNPVANLSTLVVGDVALRRRCRTILRAERIASRGAAPAIAGRLLRGYRPRVLLLDAARSPRRALAALLALRRLSPKTGVVLLGRRRPSTTFLLEAVRRGARGHLAHAELRRFLPRLVRAVAAGEAWLPRRLGAPIVAELMAYEYARRLLDRDRMVTTHVGNVGVIPRSIQVG